ncbi:MAG: hypothetical protein Q8O37_16675 [Sulfuricellaceae bacterium]|nr:hypothetical protein [Sulfuricellaceae bacterium]
MNPSVRWMLVLFLAASTVAEGKSYTPIGVSGSMVNRGAFLPVKIEDRPVLPGMRPVDLELLEDALRRKMNITIGDSREKAHQKIIRNSLRSPMKRSHIKGVLAEALFLEKNPAWGYVRKSNAPQVDVYVWRAGSRRPYGAQIKTHLSGDPLIYASDMLKDNLADRFLVPDDHVASLEKHWQAKLHAHEAAGHSVEAAEARRQLSRIGGLGFSEKQLDGSYSRAVRYAKREQYAGYVSLGAAVGLALGPELWYWWQKGSLSDQAALHAARGASDILAERVATRVMVRNTSLIPTTNTPGLNGGVLRGGLRGNAVVAITVLTVDTAFAVYEHGGGRAFHSDAFKADFAGSVSALGIGIFSGQAIASWTANPYAGLIAGTVTGMAAYIAGREVIDTIIWVINEESLRKKDVASYEQMKIHFDHCLKKALLPLEFPLPSKSLTNTPDKSSPELSNQS